MPKSDLAFFEGVSLAVLCGILVFDLLLVVRRSHTPSNKESALWVTLYAVLAIIFGAVIWQLFGAELGAEFYAGWLTEYSLSIDNLFVFIIIMSRFKVPRQLQQEVLMFGVITALILRGAFILVGATLIKDFSWIFYLFGAFLLYTAYHQAFRSHEDEEDSEGRLLSWLRKKIRVSDEFDGSKFRTTIDGRKVLTPMLMVFIAIAATDTMFAFDSIPAIFGITQNAFIVFAANVFALMGLRQLYFLLGDLLDRLVYLKYGIAFILGFIGFKLLAHAAHVNELPFVNGGHHIEWAPEIPTSLSLGVILASVAVSAIASLLKTSDRSIR